MDILGVVLVAALYINSVYCSYYHGPTAQPVVLHNGFLADTHEVAAAKNAHLATLEQQHSHGAVFGYDGSNSGEQSGSHGDIRYHGPTAIPHVLHNGHIADTHEVAAAKDEHFAAFSKAKAHGGYSGGYASRYGAEHDHTYRVAPYHGPLAKPVVLKTGYLADTLEVAAAKNAHLTTLGQQHNYGAEYGYEGSYSGEHSGSHGDIRYHGPTAIPRILHDGHIADTNEVAAAKAEHFAAFSKVKAHGGYSGGYASRYGAEHGHTYHVAPYHGPLAKPVVLKSGYLADTHEVAAAKEHHLEALHSNHHGPNYY